MYDRLLAIGVCVCVRVRVYDRILATDVCVCVCACVCMMDSLATANKTARSRMHGAQCMVLMTVF